MKIGGFDEKKHQKILQGILKLLEGQSVYTSKYILKHAKLAIKNEPIVKFKKMPNYLKKVS